jgi:hypothetical protein
MGDVDGQLRRIETQVKILLERQRLSRFDSLMFLAYPLVILGITVSLTIYSQQEALKSIQLMGLPLLDLLAILRDVLLLCLGATFVIFIIAYAFDDLFLRVVSVFVMSSVTLIPFGMLFVLIALFKIFGSVIDLSANSSIITISLFLFSATALFAEGIARITRSLNSWFNEIMQTSLKEHVVTLGPTFHVRTFTLLIEGSWSVGFLMCFTIDFGLEG